MIELPYLMAFIAAAYGAGNFLLRRLLNITFTSAAQEIAISAVSGLILFSYGTLLLGYLNLLDSRLFHAAVFLIIILCIKRIRQAITASVPAIKKKLTEGEAASRLLHAALVVMALLNMVAALAPPHSSDAVAYHLAMPKLFVQQGEVSVIPFIIPSSYPLVTEMLFLDGYLLGGGVLGELIAASIALLLAACVYIIAATYFQERHPLVAPLAALLFYTLPIVSVFNIRGFVDISTGLFGMASLLTLLWWHRNPTRRLLILAGILAGAAAATKISAYPLPAILLLAVVLFLAGKSMRIAEQAKNALAFSIPAALLVLPWLIRAFAATGNPFYPLLFGGIHLPEKLSQFWVEESLAFVGTGTSPIDLLLLPWNVTMNAPVFGELLSIGPVFLAFIPLLMFLRPIDRKIQALLGIAALALLVWFYTAQSLRYIFFVYALLAIVCAWVIGRLLETPAKSFRSFIFAMVLVTLLIHGALWAGTNNDELRVVFGLTDKEAYLEGKMTNYELLKYANTHLPEGEVKLCLFGEIRGYYSEHPYVWCHPTYQGYIDFFTLNSSDALLARLQEAGITHVVTDGAIEEWTDYYREHELPIATDVMTRAQQMMGDVLANHSTTLFENEHGGIYHLKSER